MSRCDASATLDAAGMLEVPGRHFSTLQDAPMERWRQPHRIHPMGPLRPVMLEAAT
jgi:hypothetical protein